MGNKECLSLFLFSISNDGVLTTEEDLKKPIEVTIGYEDENDNGVIDGTTISLDEMELVHYNEGTAEWEELPDQIIDDENKTITASVSSLSPFAISGGPTIGGSSSSSAGGGSIGGGSGCGVVGLDALALIGLAYLIRRKVS